MSQISENGFINNCGRILQQFIAKPIGGVLSGVSSFLYNTEPSTKLMLLISTSIYLAKDNYFRRKLVLRKILQLKKKSEFKKLKDKTYFFPRQQFQNYLENYYLNLGRYSQLNVLLIEGHEGSGKTVFFQNLLYQQSRLRPTLYISCSYFFLNTWESELGEQIGYIPKKNLSLDEDYKGCFYTLIEAIEQCSDKSNELPLIVFDDIQDLFHYNDQNLIEKFFTKFQNLNDNKQAQIILLTSDNSVYFKILNQNKMSRILSYYQFPEIPEEQFKQEIENRLFQQAQLKNPNIQNPDQLMACVDYCGSNLRIFEQYCYSFKESPEKTLGRLLQCLLNSLNDILAKPKYVQLLKYLYENGRYYHYNNNNQNQLTITDEEIKDLQNQNIIRISYENGGFYEFYSKTVRYAYERLEIKSQKRNGLS